MIFLLKLLLKKQIVNLLSKINKCYPLIFTTEYLKKEIIYITNYIDNELIININQNNSKSKDKKIKISCSSKSKVTNNKKKIDTKNIKSNNNTDEVKIDELTNKYSKINDDYCIAKSI